MGFKDLPESETNWKYVCHYISVANQPSKLDKAILLYFQQLEIARWPMVDQIVDKQKKFMTRDHFVLLVY